MMVLVFILSRLCLFEKGSSVTFYCLLGPVSVYSIVLPIFIFRTILWRGGLLGFCLDALALGHAGEGAVLGEELRIGALLGDAAFF